MPPSKKEKSFTIKWEISNPKAKLIILHGFGEHIKRYEHVAIALNGIGFSVYGLDLRGHGDSAGMQGYINSFDDYIEDSLAFLAQLKSQGIEIDYALGHSMGGLLLASLILKKKIALKAAVFSSPMLVNDPGIPKILLQLSSLLSKVAPRLRTIKVDTNKISTSPEEVYKYQTDPLVLHKGIPARTGRSFLVEMDWVKTNLKNIELPFLVITGEADQLINPEGSKILYEEAQSSDKKMLAYKGLYHELFNEVKKEVVINDVLHWFQAHMG